MIELRANGKLLLTGEYFVLDGAKALAVPTRFGQRMKVLQTRSGTNMHWAGYVQENEDPWLSLTLNMEEPLNLVRQQAGEQAHVDRIRQIIRAGESLRAGLLPMLGAKSISTHLEFPADWGLGSSSTLIAMLADWWGVDPFKLLVATFGGSGYDLACAQAKGPIKFWREGGTDPCWTPLDNWQPSWLAKTSFVYLNQKQNSREGIQRYRSKTKDEGLITEISALTAALQDALLLRQSKEILAKHENLVSNYLGLPKVQDLYFVDFPGLVKSLGAWGGDFVWVLPDEGVNVNAYFKAKGYPTILSWEEMILA